MDEIWLDKPKYTNVKSVDKKSQIPKDTWKLCPRCMKKHLSTKLQENIGICDSCDYHFPINVEQRIAVTCDPGSFVEVDADISSLDPLDFQAGNVKYKDKVAKSQKVLGVNDAVVCGLAKIEGVPVVVAVMNFAFIGGSMGSVVGEKLYRAMMLAVKKKRAMVVFSCSGGARMQEGILSLMQMAKTCVGVEMMAQAKIPFLSVFTHPTMGGVTASFASVADVMIAEMGAHIGFAGPRVIEQTVREKLPKNFQTSEFLLEHGFLDVVEHRARLRGVIAKLVRFLM